MPPPPEDAQEESPSPESPDDADGDSAAKELDALLEAEEEASPEATPSPPEEAPPEEVAEPEQVSRPTVEPASSPIPKRVVGFTARRLRRDRIAFFAGILLTGAGGFALLLGSVLHDAFRVPWVGTAYTVFGPLNVAFAAAGAVILIPGLLALRIGLRGGVIPAERASEG